MNKAKCCLSGRNHNVCESGSVASLASGYYCLDLSSPSTRRHSVLDTESCPSFGVEKCIAAKICRHSVACVICCAIFYHYQAALRPKRFCLLMNAIRNVSRRAATHIAISCHQHRRCHSVLATESRPVVGDAETSSA